MPSLIDIKLAPGTPPADPVGIPEPGDITGVVLAGGRGSRMGGEDKGLVTLHGRTMVEHVIARLRPQVGALLISANRNRERYAAFGCPVVPDLLGDYQGPLAGMAAALRAATTPYVVTVPCDSPLISTDVVARLANALARDNAEISVAHDGARTHPVFLMLRRRLLSSLLDFLNAGERKIDRWFVRHRLATADFHDCPESFVNVNDPQEHRALEARLREGTI
jgi:molybdenum cofactor guanylyltransferase